MNINLKPSVMQNLLITGALEKMKPEDRRAVTRIANKLRAILEKDFSHATFAISLVASELVLSLEQAAQAEEAGSKTEARLEELLAQEDTVQSEVQEIPIEMGVPLG